MAQASGSYAFDESTTFLELELRQRVDEEMNGFQRGGMVFELDLNDPPVPSDYGRVPVPQPAKDFEVIDDEVAIISSRVFAEAKNNSTRNPEVRDVVEAETEVNNHRAGTEAEASTSYPLHRAKRRRLLRNQAVLNWEQYMNSEDDTKVETNEKLALVPTEPPSFNCPICIGPMNEETSTKCGHIFCKKCIEAAIKVQHKCPTCRHKLRMKDVIRIYLPTST